jgi:hypothetical protein
MPFRLTLAVAAVALLATAAPALAVPQPTASVTAGVLTYSDVTDNPNTVTVSFEAEPPKIVFTESVAGTMGSSGAGCEGGGSPVLKCTLAGVNQTRILLGPGNDTLVVGAPLTPFFFSLAVEGEAGEDRIDLGGSPAYGTTKGGTENDHITPSTFYSDIDPGPGNDLVDGVPVADATAAISAGTTADGADTLPGGPGDEFVEYDDRDAGVNVSLDGLANDGAVGEGDNVGAQIDGVQGSDFADTLVGSEAVRSFLSGYDGNDVITGGRQDDVIFGGIGDDIMDGRGGDDEFPGSDGQYNSIGGGPAEVGADTFTGGAGRDRVSYRYSAAVTVTLDGQANDGPANEKDNVGSDVEIIVGTDNADTITGTTGAQEFRGLAGNDTLDDGGGAGDILTGGEGDDVLRARDALADSVSCGPGNDSAVVDTIDTTDCDTVDAAAPPVVQPPVVTPADKTPPKGTFSGLKSTYKLKAFLKGVSFFFTPSEAAALEATELTTAKKATISAVNLTLATKKLPLAAGKRKITLKASKKLVGKARTFKVTIRVVATDAAGNRATFNKTIRVKK